jgi:hypothetical protein
MTIDDLPIFHVHTVKHDRALGHFAQDRWMGERHLGYLITSGERFVLGRFVAVDLNHKIAAFIPHAIQDLSDIRVDNTYRRIDGYWGERAALVLDRGHVWLRRTFEPTDAIRFKIESGNALCKTSKDTDFQNGNLIKGGWDHEHCEICSQKICQNVNPIGMFSEPDHWVCGDCYTQYIALRSLDFIMDGQ